MWTDELHDVSFRPEFFTGIQIYVEKKKDL